MEYVEILAIVCPLVFLGGLIDAVAGGGGLITLPAYLMAGLPAHFAAGTNKVVAGMGAATATLKYFRSGKVQVRVAVWAAAGALMGGFAGAEIAKLLGHASMNASQTYIDVTAREQRLSVRANRTLRVLGELSAR